MNHLWETFCYAAAMADNEVKWAVVIAIAIMLLLDTIRVAKAYRALARKAR